jgi:hypothetical protein
MALYDNRVFSHNDEWWVAEVHGRTGAKWGDGPETIHTESIVFTCLSDANRPSRVRVIDAGKLRTMDHSSIVRVLEKAESLTSRFSLNPTNAPDDEYVRLGLPVIRDEVEGLRWIIIETTLPRTKGITFEQAPGLRVVCLDDSAYQRDVWVDDEHTMIAMREAYGPQADQAIIDSVRGLYQPYRLRP